MKNIVLATDLSRLDDYAMQRAIMLSVRLGAKLHLIYVSPDGDPHKIEAQFNRLLEHEECDASIHVLKGHSFHEILKFSDSVEADLIVLGPHKEAKSARGKNFVGETADNIIRNTSRAVLVVKKPPLAEYDKILVSVDFSPPSRRAFHEAVRLAPEAHFYLLHAYDIPFAGFIRDKYTENELRTGHNRDFEKFIKEMKVEIAEQEGIENLKITKMLSRGLPSMEIRETANKTEVRLLAIGTRGMSKLRRLLIGSIAKELLSYAPCDILITPEPPAGHQAARPAMARAENPGRHE